LQPKQNRFRSSTHQDAVFFMLKHVMTLDVKTQDIACEEKIEDMEKKKKKMKEAMIL
ncbi:hypothetical protein S83_052137, partial [Arachis hypogaea]